MRSAASTEKFAVENDFVKQQGWIAPNVVFVPDNDCIFYRCKKTA